MVHSLEKRMTEVAALRQGVEESPALRYELLGALSQVLRGHNVASDWTVLPHLILALPEELSAFQIRPAPEKSHRLAGPKGLHNRNGAKRAAGTKRPPPPGGPQSGQGKPPPPPGGPKPGPGKPPPPPGGPKPGPGKPPLPPGGPKPGRGGGKPPPAPW
jgi:hypothetical protein